MHSCTVRVSTASPVTAAIQTPLVSALDHVIWSVANLDDAVDRLTRRMGFPIAPAAPAHPRALRTATVAIGDLPVRLVERAEWHASQPIGLAMRSDLPLTDVEAEADARGLHGSGIFMIAGKPRGNIACYALSGILAPGDPGLLVVQYMMGDTSTNHSGAEPRLHGGSPLGIARDVRAQVDVASAASMSRWRKVLCDRVPPGLVLRAGERDGLSALLLRAANLWNLQTVWKDAGVDCALSNRRLLVHPSQTGGLPIEVEEG
ncbi:hypothetical protein F183_A08980 [Bryobacterales bacterium F-183]|nr:hypothetical protein F183_A08980 [Bryobacterales bacterium F-183]